MASLSIRKLDDSLYKELKARALIHGISMEEEVRQTLYQALFTPQDVGQVFRKYFKENGICLELTDHKKPHDPIDLA